MLTITRIIHEYRKYETTGGICWPWDSNNLEPYTEPEESQKNNSSPEELAIISERHSDEPEQIQTVWLGYVLGNIKGLFIAVGKDGVDGCYYEATYRSETDDVWIDVYEKKAQIKL